MTALQVTAHLDTTTVGLVEQPVMLDGPLAYVCWQRDGGAPFISGDPVRDFDLPLARWDQGGTWGWCTSQAELDIVAYTSIELRQKPPTGEFSRFTTDRKYHRALGPYKARDTTIQGVLIRTATWQVDATDRERLEDLLTDIKYIGKHHRLGHGHIAKWRIEPGVEGRWRDRPMPEIGAPPRAYRPPYHHPDRQYTVSGDAA